MGIAIGAYFNGKRIVKIGELLAEMERNAKQRHREVIALLKKGFGMQSK